MNTDQSPNASNAALRSFKIHFGDLETRRIPLNDQDSFSKLISHVRTLFSFPVNDQITVSYKDSDGDLITIGSEVEYKLALTLHANKSTITLFIFTTTYSAGLVTPLNAESVVFRKNLISKRDHHEKKEKVRKPIARFVKDVTFSNESEMEAGATFTKTWRFRNEGETTWPSGVIVKYIGKGVLDQMRGPESVPVVGIVKPGDTVDVSVQLIAPIEPGRYTGYWRLYDPSIEKKFGPRFWVQIIVPSGSSPHSISHSSSDEDKHKKKYHHRHHHKDRFNTPVDDKHKKKYHHRHHHKDRFNTPVDEEHKKKEKSEKKNKKNSSSDSSSDGEKVKEKPKKLKKAALLSQLASMGFTDKGLNVKLLKKYDRDLAKVVQTLVEKITLEANGSTNITTSV